MVPLLLLLFSVTEIKAQHKNVYFLKNNGQYVSLRDSADYIRIVQEPDSGSRLYSVKEYYTNGKRMSLSYSSEADQMKYEGLKISFYKTGRRKQIASYAAGLPVDSCYNYYPNGQLYSTLVYHHSEKSAASIVAFPDYSIQTVNDSTGKELVVNGNGLCIFYDQDFLEVAEKGQVKDGRKEGIWTGSEKRSGTSYTEIYKDGKMLSGESIRNNKIATYTAVATQPSYSGGINAFYKYLATSVVYPEMCVRMGIEGQVLLRFVVEKDGTITEITVTNEVNIDLAQEAIRVLKRSTKWKPGTMRGEAVRVVYSIPVVFSLNKFPSHSRSNLQ